MSISAEQAAARLVDRHGLDDQLTPFLASLVPVDHPDPATYLLAALDEPTHQSLVPHFGDESALLLRLALLAVSAAERVDADIKHRYHDELIALALSEVPIVVRSLHLGVENIPGYIYVGIRNALKREISFLLAMRDNPESQSNYHNLLIEVDQPDTLSFFERVCQIYTDFYACVRDDNQRQILEARLSRPDGLNLNCKYASEIAEQLELPLAEVIEELKLLQRRYLKLANQRLRSRRLPALKERPLARVRRPQEWGVAA